MKAGVALAPTTVPIGSSSRDPVGLEGSKSNLYEYVDGKALFSTDPTGTIGVPIVVTAALSAYIGCLAAHYFTILAITGHQNDLYDHCLWVCTSTHACSAGAPSFIAAGLPIRVEAVYEAIEVYCNNYPCPAGAHRHDAAEAIKDILSDMTGGACAMVSPIANPLYGYLGCPCCCKMAAWIRS